MLASSLKEGMESKWSSSVMVLCYGCYYFGLDFVPIVQGSGVWYCWYMNL